MRRFEFVQGKSEKFYELEVRGKTLVVRFGRIGTKGQQKESVLVDAKAAGREAERLIAEKTRKGYREVTGKAPKRSTVMTTSKKAQSVRAPKPADAWKAMRPKVAKAFRSLSKSGIRGATNLGYTLSEAMSDVQDSSFGGFALYHRQDAEHAAATGILHVTYGAMGPRPSAKKEAAVGLDVTKALAAEGLFVCRVNATSPILSVLLDESFLEAGLGISSVGKQLLDFSDLLSKEGFDILSEKDRVRLELPPGSQLEGDIGHKRAFERYKAKMKRGSRQIVLDLSTDELAMAIASGGHGVLPLYVANASDVERAAELGRSVGFDAIADSSAVLLARPEA